MSGWERGRKTLWMAHREHKIHHTVKHPAQDQTQDSGAVRQQGCTTASPFYISTSNSINLSSNIML